ncbi:MAG: hypothetical protein M1826_000559 [Phylliscum demangeonii]|nr:MAG: hypothetical protein M1826_000559 [Phylliscum demangeonii]
MTTASCLFPVRNPGGRGAAPPPPGVVPNFDHPASHRSRLLAANIIGLSVAGIFVCLRIYTRQRLTRRLGFDDATSVAAMVLSVIFSIVVMIATRFGWGIHCWDFDQKLVPAYYKASAGRARIRVMEIAITSTYSITIFVVKAAILFLYIRIFASSRPVLYAAWTLFGMMAIFTVCAFFLTIFACNPVSDYWRPDIVGNCIDTVNISTASAAVSILTDVMIFLLPLRQIWKLHLPLKQRIGVIGILGTGLSACIISVVRVLYLAALAGKYDVTWHIYPNILWTIVEVNVGIICGCMPTLKPLVRHHCPALIGSSNGSNAPSEFMSTPSSSFTKLKRIYKPFAKSDRVRLPDSGAGGPGDNIELGVGFRTPSVPGETFHGWENGPPQWGHPSPRKAAAGGPPPVVVAPLSSPHQWQSPPEWNQAPPPPPPLPPPLPLPSSFPGPPPAA